MYFSLPRVNRGVGAKLKQQTKIDRQKIEHLEETNRELKNDKDFLLAQIKGNPGAPACTSKSGTMAIQLALVLDTTDSSFNHHLQ